MQSRIEAVKKFLSTNELPKTGRISKWETILDCKKFVEVNLERLEAATDNEFKELYLEQIEAMIRNLD